MPVVLLLLVLIGGCRSIVDEPPTDRIILDLAGNWLFHIGDERQWAAPDLDDSEWDAVAVPSAWENEGYAGYDGYAWYRKHFVLNPEEGFGPLYVDLGRIDDVDEVYLNGRLIGATGHMPPEYKTAYDRFRSYLLPSVLLNQGDNVLAVRVYDERLEGGILEGSLTIIEPADVPAPLVDLSGNWLFRTGDDPAWKERFVSREGWTTVTVPAPWEPQGFEGYDGFGWYRHVFYLPDSLRREDLALLLGKIDDVDEAYLNGRRIGRTGNVGNHQDDDWTWQTERVYIPPRNVYRFGEKNVLAVRVFDRMGGGGIHEGPVGFVTQRSLTKDRERPDGGAERIWARLRDSVLAFFGFFRQPLVFWALVVGAGWWVLSRGRRRRDNR